MTSLAHTYLPS
uniref:Uncharacterized protein n=1 Tax=Anguilla anguilla TaxID=7936 RepID=A0A0E9W5B1_ANGAN